MKRSIYCCYAPVEPHQRPCHYLFYFQFSYNFINITHSLFKKKKIFTLSQTFLIPLPLHLPTTLYFNIILPLSLYFPLFCLFLFSHSYYKFVIFSFILCIVFPNKKKFSLSHTIIWFFFFLILEPLWLFSVIYGSIYKWFDNLCMIQA